MSIKGRLARNQHFANLLARMPDWVIQLRKDEKINIELTNHCNLKCPLCATANYMHRPKGFMEFDNFKSLIDQIKHKKQYAAINFAGEQTLHPQILDMIKYAADNGITTMISTNGTQLHKFSPEDVVKSRLTHLIISCDGISQKTLSKYRVGANFNQIINSVQEIVKAKDRLHSDTPILDLQYIRFHHNVHEIAEAKMLFYQIGVNRLVLRSAELNMGFHPELSDAEYKKAEKKFLPEDDKYNKKYMDNPIKICSWLWQSVIYWNGDVVPCCFCFDGEHKVGNVFEKSFNEIWRSEKYKQIRKQILKGSLDVCQQCRRLSEVEPFNIITFQPIPDGVLPKNLK